MEWWRCGGWGLIGVECGRAGQGRAIVIRYSRVRRKNTHTKAITTVSGEDKGTNRRTNNSEITCL